ncbi:MAG: hypothetical protein E7016_01870 [Alphaproteobacteria bacterium]|nr:hypothetical protein [Alphaproteobacteria bacterium]
MRKYFLLSAVALMAASTANATDGTSNLKASATIIEPTIIECTPIDFGTLYFGMTDSTYSGVSYFMMDVNGTITNTSPSKYSLLFDGQGTPGTCTGLPDGATFTVGDDNKIYLDEAEKIFVNSIKYADGKLTGKLSIYYDGDDTVLDGSELTGTAVVQFTYE